MSPSTKNMKERIQDIILNGVPPYKTYTTGAARQTAEVEADAILALLSSELSLAINELREAAQDAVINNVEMECADMIRVIFSSFDAKAKEILGESP